MSRTYRRKNSHMPEWVTSPYRYNGRGGYRKVILEGKERAKAINKYHADGQESTYLNPPSWFVNMFCQRPFRRHQKEICRNLLKSNDLEDYVFENPESADWMWS